MNTRDLLPHEILQDAIGRNCAKSEFSTKMLVILSFLGGGYIGFGYLACLRVINDTPAEWDGLAALLGASVFSIALICILIGGGELATGSTMIVALGKLTDRISTHKLVYNWLIVSLGNLVGAVAMAYFLDHCVGLAEGPIAAEIIATAEARVNMDFSRASVSATVCSWMVYTDIWFYFDARYTSGRILTMWFPVMIFVLTDFQHFVANILIIPAGIWAGANVSWGRFFYNMIPVFLGNVLGGSPFIAASYLFAYKHLLKGDFSI